MKILFLGQAPEGNQSTKHRVQFLANELESRGHDCSVCPGKSRELYGRILNHVSVRGVWRLSKGGAEFDAVVINRGASPLSKLAVIAARQKGVPTIFDIDDALWRNRHISGTRIPNPAAIHLDSIFSEVNAVAAGNKQTMDYVRRHDGTPFYAPTPVNRDIFHSDYEPPRDYDKIVLGWMGNGPVHVSNLSTLVAPLKRLGEEYDIRFRMISSLGDESIHQMFSNVETNVDIDYGFSSWEPMETIAAEMATFDIALLPLNSSDEFMEGKTAMKVFEHLAVGVPVVATDFGAYRNVLSDGETGMLVDGPDDWYTTVSTLIEDRRRRSNLAKRGEDFVEEYTVKAFADRYEEVLVDLDS